MTSFCQSAQNQSKPTNPILLSQPKINFIELTFNIYSPPAQPCHPQQTQDFSQKEINWSEKNCGFDNIIGIIQPDFTKQKETKPKPNQQI